jgi:hypothetical protein
MCGGSVYACTWYAFILPVYTVCFFVFPFPSLVYQLITGSLPFDGAAVTQVVERMLHAPAPRIGGSFSEILKMSIGRMLEKVFFCLWGVMFYLFSGTDEETNGWRSTGAGGSAHIDPAT